MDNIVLAIVIIITFYYILKLTVKEDESGS
jgi:hypothetical protein